MSVPGTTPRDNDSFPQQGALNWVSFSTSVVSSSLQVAQRISATGVSPITFQAGLALSTRFHLAELEYRRIKDAFRNLHVFSSFGKLLWFKLGHKSFLALLAETKADVNCAAFLSQVWPITSTAWRSLGLRRPPPMPTHGLFLMLSHILLYHCPNWD